MHLIRGLSNFQRLEHGCVLTIGNFDGVHTGHRKVIEKLVSQAKTMNLPVVVMIFEPQPLEFFLAENAPSRLMRLREKILKLKSLPIDKLVVVKFNQTLANYKADDFISDFLVDKLNVKYLIVGDDFHFGKARSGNFTLLKEKGLHYGFEVEDTQSHFTDTQRVSSTLIRDALSVGDLSKAKLMLGCDYSVCGRIVHGNERGRTIGFPTANVLMSRKNTPLSGVFSVIMTGIDGKKINGIANVGNRPTVDGGNTIILETHLFNFNQDIYGRYVEVHFKQKIRDEVRFNSLTELKEQIAKDIVVAKEYMQNHP